MNLAAIPTLAQRAPAAPVGYSDHTLGIDACVAGRRRSGARILEKHFTLDHDFSDFRDHKLSADPGELRELVRARRAASRTLLGSPRSGCRRAEAELERRRAALDRRGARPAARPRGRRRGPGLAAARATGWPRARRSCCSAGALLRDVPEGESILAEDVGVTCPICGCEDLELAFATRSLPPGETAFGLSPEEYRREFRRCAGCGHYLARLSISVERLYSGEYVDATYDSAGGLERAYQRIMALPPERSDNVQRVARIVARLGRSGQRARRGERAGRLPGAHEGARLAGDRARPGRARRGARAPRCRGGGACRRTSSRRTASAASTS